MTNQEKKAATKRILLFILFAFAVAWALFLTIPLAGLQTSGSFAAVALLTCAMFAPALASILTRLVTKEGFKDMWLLPRFKGNIKTYLLVFFGPTVMILLSSVLYFVLFPASFDRNLTTLTSMLQTSGAGAMPAQLMLAISLAQMILIGPVINLLPTMGEELGWRGYLLPKLRGMVSDRAALVITGLIWGVWHAPIIAVGHNYGTDYTGYPWVGILTMIVFCVSLGIIEGYFTIRVGSALPAGIIHSAVNAGAALPMMLMIGDYNPILGPSIAGLIGGLPMLVVAVVLFIKSDGRRPVPAGEEVAVEQEA